MRQAPQVQDEGAIIVTATKRASTVQDVPFSINAQTQEDIQRAHAQTIEDISRNVAGLTVQNLGPGQSQVSVRGVSAGQIVRDQPGVKEQVGVYLDESVDLAVAVHARLRPVRPEPRRDAARPAGHACSARGRSAAPSATSPTSRSSRRIEGEVEGDVNVAQGGAIGGDSRAALNLPLGDRRRGPRRRSTERISAASSTPSAQQQARTSTTAARYGGRLSMLLEPDADLRITPRVVYQKATADGFNREEFYNLYDNQFTSGAAGTDLGQAHAIYLKLPREVQGRDVCSPT